jgi:hypothetical protein
MATHTTTDTSHSNGARPASRAAARKAAKASAPARARRKRNQAGKMIATGAFILAGAVFVIGLASVAALIAGYEPPGYEKEARRVRRFALEHRPDFSKSREALDPVGKQFGRGERWIRDRFRF